MAKSYLVFELENGVIKSRETRPKAWHEHGSGAHHGGNEQATHTEMLSKIRDCEALIAGGMGRPMYEAILEAGIKPYVTDLSSAEEAVLAYARGTLDNQTQTLH